MIGKTKARLFIVILVIFASIPAYAQHYKIDFRILNGISYANSRIKQTPYDNWQDNYTPWGGSMTTEVYNFAFSWDLGLQAELILQGEKFSFGIPVYYYLTINSWPSYYDEGGERFSNRDYLTISKTIGGIKVDWWNDVPLHKVKLRKTSPAVGISLSWGIKKSRFIRFQGAVQKYAIITEDFAGVDRFGDVNTARVVNRETIENGLGWRFDIGLMTKQNKWIFGVYYERNGSRTNEVGLSLCVRIKAIEF